MKKILFNGLLFFLLTVFVAASGGMFFILHHCKTHNVTELVFVKSEGDHCCKVGESRCKDETANIPSCCQAKKKSSRSVSVPHGKCCTNNPVFLKISFQFLKTQLNQLQHTFSFLADLSNCILNVSSISPQFIIEKLTVKPPGFNPFNGSPFSFSLLRL